MLHDQLKKYEQTRPFNSDEAWALFRIAAITEAVGWSLLIIGILFNKYFVPGNSVSIPLAGSIHGTIFLVYIAAVIVLYPSLGWRRPRTIVAGLASVPPYGSLVFEQWAAYKRWQVRLSYSIFQCLLAN